MTNALNKVKAVYKIYARGHLPKDSVWTYGLMYYLGYLALHLGGPDVEVECYQVTQRKLLAVVHDLELLVSIPLFYIEEMEQHLPFLQRRSETISYNPGRPSWRGGPVTPQLERERGSLW